MGSRKILDVVQYEQDAEKVSQAEDRNLDPTTVSPSFPQNKELLLTLPNISETECETLMWIKSQCGGSGAVLQYVDMVFESIYDV